MREVDAILAALRSADAEFEAVSRLIASRAPYALSPTHELPSLLSALAKARGCAGEMAGMSFWTDAAILGEAGIPSVLFGPGGAGLHSAEEYVTLADVEDCAQVLCDLAVSYCKK
jgi:acetylornithine deacetylase